MDGKVKAELPKDPASGVRITESNLGKTLKKILPRRVERKPYQIFAWMATILLFFGATCNALNIYPLNIWVMISANLMHLTVGLLWREPSIIGLNIGMTGIYFIGALNIS